MTQQTKWANYTKVEDLAINLRYLQECIGPVDPATGCQEPVKGGRHKQGYLMISAHYADQIGQYKPTRIMTTAHRVLARLKFKRPMTKQDKVYHSCGNMKCCNIDHIEVGGYKEIHAMMARLELHQGGKKPAPTRPDKVRVGFQADRKYIYSIEEMLYARYHTGRETADHLAMDIKAAYRLCSASRYVYKWLDQYDPAKTENPLKIVDIKRED